VSVILFLIPLSIAFAVFFLAAFVWAVRSGQFEDTCTPSMRVLADDVSTRRKSPAEQPLEGVRRNTPERAAISIEAQTMTISEKADAAPGD
jgi:cbb3-type cytochrome oxidase maturation protein